MLPGLLFLVLAGSSPQLEVLAFDAANDRPLRRIAGALVGVDGLVYARFDGARFAGDRSPGAGDRLYVYRRGYDLEVVTLAGAQKHVTVRLRACASPCVLRLAGAGADRAETSVQVLVRVPGAWRESPIRDSYEVRARGARVRIAVARGTDTRALVRTRPGVASPALHDLAPGRTLDLRYDAPRAVTVRREPGLHLDVAAVEVFADRLWQPAAPPERIDAWRWRLNRPGWLREAVAAGDDVIGVAPDIPFHVFASVRGRGIYRHVPRAAGELDLRRPHRSRLLAQRPVVDGRPLREGAWIAPGRLDLFTVSSLAQLSAALAGCIVQAGPIEDAWEAVTLPDAAWLTVWHPETGLAHLPWKRGAAPSGRFAPGRIVLTIPRRFRAKGTVSVFPVWKGTGAVTIVPPDRLLRRPVRARDRTVTLRGLPPGRYGVDVRVLLSPVKKGTARRLGRTLEVEVPATGAVRRPLPTR